MNKSLTIVLPVHNRESRLRAHVREMLDLASELTTDFSILIVDDGSTDATFEVAEDLAAHYPQVSLRRHRQRSGLGPTIDYVQRSVRTDAVIFHDGVSPIDLNQMRNLWRRWIVQSTAEKNAGQSASGLQSEICDFANLPAIHAALEQAHGKVLGFQLVAPRNPETTMNDAGPTLQNGERTEAAHLNHHPNVGRIPRLPRPKFMAAIADFALGE